MEVAPQFHEAPGPGLTRFSSSHVMKAAIIVVSAILSASNQLPMTAQTPATPQEDSALESSPLAGPDLPLDAAQRLELENAIQRRDYKRAETLLVEEAERDPKSVRAARLLVIAGGIFFLDGQYLNSVDCVEKSGSHRSAG